MAGNRARLRRSAAEDDIVSKFKGIKARPTVYAGVQMRSRLEARAAEYFDTAGVLWQYEPMTYASSIGQYLPDFELTGEWWAPWCAYATGRFDSGGSETYKFYAPRLRARRLFVEVKPCLGPDLLDWLDERRNIIRATIPDAQLILFTDDEGPTSAGEGPLRLFICNSCGGNYVYPTSHGIEPFCRCEMVDGRPYDIARVWARRPGA